MRTGTRGSRCLGASAERDSLTAAELDRALAEQRRSGRLLGRCSSSAAMSAARRWRGRWPSSIRVGLHPHPMSAPETPASADAPSRRAFGAQADRTKSDDGPWRPTRHGARREGVRERGRAQAGSRGAEGASGAPARRDPGRGRIHLGAGADLGAGAALALAEQHGVELGSEDELGQELETVLEPASPDSPRAACARSPSFACELVQRENPRSARDREGRRRSPRDGLNLQRGRPS